MSIKFHTKEKTTEVPTMKSLNILGHAQIEEIELGSRCGGYGECGGDKVQVTVGREFLSPVTDPEREHLTEEELEKGMRLGCQCFPESDGAEVEVEIKVKVFT
jgi:ferredoxin